MMRKTVLILVALVVVGKAPRAQETEIKPQVGDWRAEVNFSPVSSSPIRVSQLMFKKHTTENQVFRIGVSLGGEFRKPEEDTKQSTVEVSVRPGFEKHFEGTERLSPFVGGEVELALKGSRFSINDDIQDYKVKGALDQYANERGFFRAGINILFGADYYFTQRVYIGTEFGFGLQLTRYADIVEIFDGDEEPAADTDKGGSIFQFGPNYNGAFRLGFAF